MQEISRHAIHAREVLKVMVDTLDKLQQYQKQVYETPKSTKLDQNQWEQALSHLQLQIQMVRALKERSISTLERHNSEITSVRNIESYSSDMPTCLPLALVYLIGGACFDRKA